jgi:TetR/AcrR family transcriptional regulator
VVVSGRDRQLAAWNDTVQTRDQQFNLKRTALLKEAARAFSSQGYQATSLDDVAKTLGVTKPALYYYIKNKQEILFECHMLSQDLGDRAFEHAYKTGRTGREILLSFANEFIESHNSEIGDCAVLVEFQALDPANRKIVAARRDKAQHQMQAIIEKGMADGSIRQVDPKLTVFFFMGAVNWMARWFDKDGPKSGAEIAKVFTDLLDHAVSP